MRQLGERSVAIRHKCVKRIFALAHYDHGEARRQAARHVLHGMHRNIGAPFLHGDFKLLDEQPLAADLRQRPVKNLIAARGHTENLDPHRRIETAQALRDPLALHQRQTAFARGNGQTAGYREN